MLSVLEKVIFLQNVDVFSAVPSEQLAYLAAIAEEREVSQGEQIYAALEPADAMYLVLEGQVRLHRGTVEVTIAQAQDAFGTWALFDDQQRLVTATALVDSCLLRIDKGDFIDVLAENVELTRGVLKALVQRLRGVMERFGGLGA